MIRSIRVTLTVWYVGILALILCGFSWVLYSSVSASLTKYLNVLLMSQADGVASSLLAFRDAQAAVSPAGPGNWESAPTATLSGEIDAGRFPDLVQRWVEQAKALATLRPIRVIDNQGKVLGTSIGFEQLSVPLNDVAIFGALHGRTMYEVAAISDEERVKLVSRPVVENGRVIYIVQVAAPLRQVEASLERLRRWLLWLVPLTLAITSAVGWFLATTALQPIGQMITQAQQVGAEHLDQRLQVPRSGDELERLAVTFNDMLERLEHAFKRLRQFSAAASHELRTPLTVLKGELEVALRKPRDAEEYQRVLHTQLEAINDMVRVVEELLMLARSDVVEGALEWQPVELAGLARHVVQTLQGIADQKSIRQVVVSDAPVWVRGERRLLERLIANLLENAIRHTPAQGEVVVESHTEADAACLVVRDTGPGISEDKLPQIFDQFFRRARSTATGPSTGLGLGICRWIAEAHQGQIHVDSPPGQGASFTLRLPLA